MGAPDERQELDPVLETEGDVVAEPQPKTSEQIGNAARLLVEFAEGHRLAGASHDDSETAGVLGGPVARVLGQRQFRGGGVVAHDAGPYRWTSRGTEGGATRMGSHTRCLLFDPT